ncbi:hypothetical protein CVIRNUC_002103 [Coccomyxa viridis]|uniref:Ubiquilin n=1 Tax=Coccomyxa viridis TaxID=1274662 RepID=A0AAV1HY32_9CHLO|nr:hypothetical protein CVIRNUC_002103 [Coccomyxa viridis]
MSAFTVFLKVTGGEKLSLEVTPKQTIAELKAAVATQCDIPAENQRLIYKGQVLKDEKTIEDYALAADHVLHLVKGRALGGASGTSSAAPASQAANGSIASSGALPGLGGAEGMGAMGGLGNMGGMGGVSNMMNNPEMMAQMMQSPIMQSMLNDPEMLRNMVQSTPGMSEVMDRNPEFRQMLSNPEVLRESMRLAANPALMREHMRNTDRAVSNIESHPEGFNALRRMYENIEEPLRNAAAQETTPTAAGGAANPFASLFGNMGGAPLAAGPATSGAPSAPPTSAPAVPNTNPLPNPWAPPAASGASAASGLPLGAGMGSMPGGGMFGMPAPADLASNLQNPMWQQAMQQLLSNPDMLRSSVDAAASVNPQIRQMLDRDPSMRENLMNPDMLRRAMEPANISAMMQMQQAMQQLQSSGMMPPGAMPGLNAGLGGPMGGGALGSGPGNPQDINAFMDRMGLSGAGAFGAPAAPGGGAPPVADPEAAYASQLEQLQGMGFYDRQANIVALQATGGNVSAAVDRLLQGPQ